MKNILIIGGSGTISSPITKLLAGRKDVNLYVLNRGQKKNVVYDNVKYLKGDIKNIKSVKKVIGSLEFDIVINFVLMDIHDARINYELFKEKTGLFVFISTVCVLDGIGECVIKETGKYGNKDSLYGQNKENCEKFFIKKHLEENFPYLIIRPSQTYADDRIPLSVKGNTCWSVVNRMLEHKKVIVHGDGQSVWASTHADDFARAFVELIFKDNLVGEIYQIMNPDIHTWDKVYLTLSKLLKVEYKPVYISGEILKMSKKYDFKQSVNGDKRWSKVFVTDKLLNKIDFKSEISLEDGLKRYLDYMEKHPELKIKDEAFDDWCDYTIELYESLIEQFKDKI